MAIEIIGIVLATSHVLTVGLIILWFGLDKPKSLALFRQRFRRAFFGPGSKATGPTR